MKRCATDVESKDPLVLSFETSLNGFVRMAFLPIPICMFVAPLIEEREGLHL